MMTPQDTTKSNELLAKGNRVKSAFSRSHLAADPGLLNRLSSDP